MYLERRSPLRVLLPYPLTRPLPYRSISPLLSQDVIDGDLCETFASLPLARQKALAEDLDRSPHEVLKKLEDVRYKML